MSNDNNSLFLRHYMGQKPGETGNNWTGSPDIIPNGTSICDPTSLVTEIGYNTEPPSKIFLGQPNFIYVRGKYTASTDVTSRLWLHYAPSNVVLWPQSWQSDGISCMGIKNQNYTEVTSKLGQIVVSDPPFVWVPPALGQGADHYCLVAFAENPTLSDPPKSPMPKYSFATWDDLAQFVISNPCMAWRNTIPVSGGVPEWTITAPITGAPNGGQFHIGLQCYNMPTDGYFSLQVPGPDSKGSINLIKKPIIDSNMNFALPVKWKAGYSSSVIITWSKGDTNPPTGATIAPVVIRPKNELMSRIPSFFEKLSDTQIAQSHQMLTYNSQDMDDGEVEDYYFLGGIPYQFL